MPDCLIEGWLLGECFFYSSEVPFIWRESLVTETPLAPCPQSLHPQGAHVHPAFAHYVSRMVGSREGDWFS